jgi:hypothetical protein
MVVRLAGRGGPVYTFGGDYYNAYSLYTGRVHIPALQAGQVAELRGLLAESRAVIIADEDRLARVLSDAEREHYTVYRERVNTRMMVLLRGGAWAGARP